MSTENFWSSEDRDNLKSFFATRTGGKLISQLAEAAPTLFASGDTNKILIRNGELLGFQSALRELLTLSLPEPTPDKEKTEYPSLLDDAAWSDGQKIETPT